MKRLVTLLLVCGPACGLDTQYQAWNSWLKKHVVVQGKAAFVRYDAAKQDLELTPIVKEFSELKQTAFDQLSEDNRLAFLINAYNALTIKLIVDHYPVKSIKDLGSFWRSAGKRKFFKLFGKDEHLDGIGDTRIRNDFNDPRVHFALVPAAKGGPNLRLEPYLGAQLDRQLNEAAIAFLSDTEKNRWDKNARKLYLSKVFDWYERDFRKKYGDVLNYVAPRLTSHIEDESLAKMGAVAFLDYDWSLNESAKIDATH